MSTRSRVTTQGKDQQVLVGIHEELQSMSTLILGAETYTPQSLADFVQSRIDLGNTVATAKAAWLDAVARYAALDRKANLVLGDLRNVVIAAFGRESLKLATFGFVPPRRPTLTQEQVVASVAKGKATRKARKTMGKKQKALVKGEVAVAPETAAPIEIASPSPPTTPG